MWNTTVILCMFTMWTFVAPENMVFACFWKILKTSFLLITNNHYPWVIYSPDINCWNVTRFSFPTKLKRSTFIHSLCECLFLWEASVSCTMWIFDAPKKVVAECFQKNWKNPFCSMTNKHYAWFLDSLVVNIMICHNIYLCLL